MVLTILALMTALATPRVAGWVDRLAVMRSAQEFSSFFNSARMGAVHWSSRIRINITRDSLIAIAEGKSDSVLIRVSGPAIHGVSLDVSRADIRLYPTGVGLGAANTRLVLQRGAFAETLTVSRLGRLRR
ncbi:MAG: hypothetical protein JSW51_12560 [Gemmatimonadota bacterium]|nr:MAG: hypothetical protein JSW51_12560 [Gemmatimonadota bacterium]